MNGCLSLTEAIMYAVARRIARLHVTNPTEAEADYKSQVSAMSEAERQIFDIAIVQFAIQGE